MIHTDFAGLSRSPYIHTDLAGLSRSPYMTYFGYLLAHAAAQIMDRRRQWMLEGYRSFAHCFCAGCGAGVYSPTLTGMLKDTDPAPLSITTAGRCIAAVVGRRRHRCHHRRRRRRGIAFRDVIGDQTPR